MSSSPKPHMSLSRRQIFELVVRFVLGFAFAIAAGTYLRNGYTDFCKLDFAHLQPHQIGHAISVLVIGLYTALIAGVYLVRLRPLNRFPGIFPTVAALLGGFLMAAFLFLDTNKDLPLGAQILSGVLVILGNGLAIVVLSHLGRSFSILPESRRLVTHGAYSIVRHPLYLAEAISSLGITIIFLSPLALVILVTQLAWQLVRIHYEEKILMENFPEYKKYAKHTKCLIPWIY
jgi:protein-S-isoprenylcysteine O-methyltransferase Ste14